MRSAAITAALWLATFHERCAMFWNDVAEALHTGRTITEVRRGRSDAGDMD